MTCKKSKNIGQRSRYYIKDSHPAIISADVFDKVQEEMARRASIVEKEDGMVEASGSKYNGKYTFWEICSCAVIVARHIAEERKGARWFGDVRQELKKERRRASNPLLWMKSGLRKS